MVATGWTQGLDALAAHEWERARGLLATTMERGQTPEAEHLLGYAEATWWTSDLDSSIAARERAFAVLTARGDELAAALAAIDLARDHGDKARPSVARAWAERARDLVAKHPESRPAAYLARMQGRHRLEEEGDPQQALASFDEGLRIAEAIGDRDLVALLTHDRGQALVGLGRIDEGIALMESAMVAAAAGEVGPVNSGRIYCNMIGACLDMVDYGRAAEWNDAAEQWCETIAADAGYPGVCRVKRSEINRHRGLLDAAESGARRAHLELGHFVSFTALAHAELGNVHLERGDLDAAESEFLEARALGHDAMPGFAVLQVAQGHPEAAAASMRPALAALPPAPLHRARLLPAAAEVLAAAGDVDAAAECAVELDGIAAQFGFPALRAAAAQARGTVAAARGEHTAAILLFREAFQLWAETGLPYEAARSRAALGASLTAVGEVGAARAEFTAAGAEFARLGARIDLGRIESRLAGDRSRRADPVDVARSLLAGTTEVMLRRYRVVGAYTRYDEAVRNGLVDARQRIRGALERPTGNRENHLIWAAPGSGKTFFVQEVARSIPGARYVELNLAGAEESAFAAAITAARSSIEPMLVLVDELDARPGTSWPYELLLPLLDANAQRSTGLVVVLAGSTGRSIDELKAVIRDRPKGADMLSRIPSAHDIVVDPLGVGDQVLVALSQICAAGARYGKAIESVEKAALFYLAVTPFLANPRQLAEFAARAVGRMSAGEERLKYDHLFSAGDPENKQFWMNIADDALVGRYVTLGV